jgi:hypothetical protein
LQSGQRAGGQLKRALPRAADAAAANSRNEEKAVPVMVDDFKNTDDLFPGMIET